MDQMAQIADALSQSGVICDEMFFRIREISENTVSVLGCVEGFEMELHRCSEVLFGADDAGGVGFDRI
jgi:hypothetical protein